MKFYITVILLSFATMVSAQTFKVMTYNIRLDVASDGVNQWSNRREKLPALIAKYDPDLVGLQEVMHHQLLDILKALPQYAYIGVARDDGKEKGEYSCILYKKDKFTVDSNKTSWLSETPEVPGSKSWDAAITRVLTRGIFTDKKSNRKFFYANTHFDHIGKEARKRSAEIILDVINKESVGLPVIVTGDFNSQPTEDPYKVISSSLKDSRESSTQGTFCTFNVNGPACTTIDYIFYLKFTSRDYKVITDNDGTYYPSDHLPVMATLEY